MQLPPLEQREADLPFAVEHAFAVRSRCTGSRRLRPSLPRGELSGIPPAHAQLARDPHLTYTDVARMPVMWDEISERVRRARATRASAFT